MILNGKSAAPGVVTGSIYIFNEKYIIPAESTVPLGQEQSVLDRYLSVKKQALNELEEIRLVMEKTDSNKAFIFDAHKEIVEDIIINEEITARILNDRWTGDWAVYQVYESVINVLCQTNDVLISQRTADFDDVRALLLKLWTGQKNEGLSALKEPVIIACNDLKPSDTATMDKEKVLAILTATGGETSHTAIIAKSYGIPTILGIEGLLDHVKQGQQAAVNATEGLVIIDPEKSVIEEFNKKIQAFKSDKKDAESYLAAEARTICGVRIEIALNISNITDNDEELKAQSYTDSVGLFRTEFLFMGNTLPTEYEQFESYKKVLECFKNKPVILRTLDIGADKQAPCLDLKREENPSLGIRGIRFCFNNPEIFKTQLRAALRAAVYGDLWLMLPMISSLDEIREAKKMIAQAKDELKTEGIKSGEVKTGIMIEVPSIALVADAAAKETDFASIGTNDLCQFLCAADRMNSAVDSCYSPYHPAMLKLIKKAAESYALEGKPLSICGEYTPAAVPLLIGLGLRKFSMGAASVAAVKRSIASITVEKAEKMAGEALVLTTAFDVEELLKP